MKFIHIADIHLGATPDSNMSWGAARKKEIWNSFENIVSVCNQEEVDLLLIAGDLFHRQPLLRELKEVDYILGRLQATQVVIMAGNHDYISARSYYTGYAWNAKVHMFYKDSLEIMDFPELGVDVYGFSYLSRDITEPRYDNIRPDTKDRIHILLAHGGDDRNIPINKKKLCASGFDYIALGHIHKPEIISNKAAYSGSLEPLDKNETGERGYILGEIDCNETGERRTTIRFMPSSTRQYQRINLTVDPTTTNGSLKDLVREAIRENGADHLYSFYLQGFRDEAVHFDTDDLLKLGNVIEAEDHSVPDYDFDALYRENSDNIIGMFISKIRENAKQDEVAKKALYYGLEALLGAKE